MSEPNGARVGTESGLPTPIQLSAVPEKVTLACGVQDLLLAGELGLVGGPDGVLKSTTVLAIGCAMAGGYRFGGRFQTTQGPVLLVSGEDPAEIMSNRARAICRGHGWDPEHVLPNVHVLALSGLDLRDPDWQRHLVAIVTEIRPGLIALDPFYELVTGDENSNSDAREIVRFLRYLTTICQSVVLLVHHFKKAAEGVSKSDLFRGANAIVKASRQTYAISPGPDDTIVLECVKFSRAAIKGTVREKFALRPTIITDDDNEALWVSARLDFVSVADARFNAAHQFVLDALANGERLTTTQLKDLATERNKAEGAPGAKISGADIGTALRFLSSPNAGRIDYLPGPKNAKLWGLTADALVAGQAGQAENLIAGQTDCLPGNHDSDALCLPAPFRGQTGKQGSGSLGKQTDTTTHTTRKSA